MKDTSTHWRRLPEVSAHLEMQRVSAYHIPYLVRIKKTKREKRGEEQSRGCQVTVNKNRSTRLQSKLLYIFMPSLSLSILIPFLHFTFSFYIISPSSLLLFCSLSISLTSQHATISQDPHSSQELQTNK